MPTIDDVAKLANVSKSTVSQYLNNRYEYMGAETKIRIEKAIEELHYIPNHIGRSLKQKRTSMIGVIVANILHTFSTKFTRAIEDLCNEKGIHVILCNADDDPIKERKYIEMLRARQVDGLFVFPTSGNRDLYEKMLAEDYPLVFIDRFVEDLNIDAVLIDNYEATRLAVQHFLSQGYEKMGILTTTLVNQVTPRVERVEGFRKAVQENGLPVHEEWIKGVKIDQMQAALGDMFENPIKPQAMLAGNDLTLMEILKFVKHNRLKIPEDLAIIGIDHVSFASFYEPSITTIVQQIDEIAERAFELMDQKVNQKARTVSEKQIIRISPKLIERNSC